MSIDIKTISQLRDQTGAGIGDCKKAIEEAGGDIDKAMEILRKKGEAKAAKKADRATKEGIVAISSQEDKIAVTALACETDFVSRNEDFIAAAEIMPQKLLELGQDSFKIWSDEFIKNELIVKIGENLQISYSKIFTGDILGSYIHSNKKVGAVVVLVGGNQDLANDLAMQVVAMSPQYIKSADIPTEIIEKEKDIYREQLKNEGKPEQIWDKIIEGKLNKYYEEVCLVNQLFIKDEDKKINDLLSEAGATVQDFAKFQV